MKLLVVFLIFNSFAIAFFQGIVSETESVFKDASSSESSLFESFNSESFAEQNEAEGDIIYTMEITSENTFSIGFNDTVETETAVHSEETTNGTDVESKWSSCSLHPCKNGGECIEDPLSPFLYRCQCPEGFSGLRCGVRDDCYLDENEVICDKGACVYSEDAKSKTCKCFFQQYWDNHEKECREAEPPCFPNPCRNGGWCKVKTGDLFKCFCHPGYEGISCNVKNKCGEGDRCDGEHCVTNEEGDEKYCSCGSNRYWNQNSQSCEDIVAPCIPNPCGNNGTCTATSSGDSFNCSCTGNFIDDRCKIPNICFSTDEELECGGNGLCKVSESSAECVCEEGFYLDEDSYTCREVKMPCFPNPCANDGLCTPFDGHNFNCTCSEGFKGHLCKERDLCTLQGGEAFCGEATCKSDHSLNTFYCECFEEHYFDFGSRSCLKIDLCPLMTCENNEICSNSTCVCQPNYKMNNETGNCEANFCAANPCPIEEMMCMEGEGIEDYYCSCPKGFAFNGTHCAVAACEFPSLNECDQLCHSIGNGSYTCSCLENFRLNEDGLTCDLDIVVSNETATCANKTCDKGSCIIVDEIEICTCPSGLVERDGECIDKCSAKNMPDGYCPDNHCEPFNNGFKCICDGKYALSKDGLTCTNRRMCEEGEIGWKACKIKNAICEEDWNSDLGYTCKCPFPQIMTSYGVCQDICSIEDFVRNCSFLGAKCNVNTDGTQMCKCPPLYRQPTRGEFCKEKADYSYLLTIPIDMDSYKTKEKKDSRMKRSLFPEPSIDYFQIQTDIEKSMATIFPELLQSNIVICTEQNEYFLCKVEMQFKAFMNEDLKRLKSPNICISTDNSGNKCLIPPSLVVRKSQLKDELRVQETDPCEEDVKRTLCGSDTVCVSSGDKKSFNCTCRPGYERRDEDFPFVQSTSYIEICNDVNECANMYACSSYATCTNIMGSYACSCIPGYRNQDKTSDPKVDDCVEICNPSPCVHGTCIETGEHDFECKCDTGYTGALCDLRDESYENAQRNTIIVGAVLGGVLLITIILFIVTISRLKRKKVNEEPDHMIYAAEMTERRGAAVNNAYQRE